jgi:hypothetical protein
MAAQESENLTSRVIVNIYIQTINRIFEKPKKDLKGTDVIFRNRATLLLPRPRQLAEFFATSTIPPPRAISKINFHEYP